MRSNGVPDFPDPNGQGLIQINNAAGGGLKIDISFPATIDTVGARSGEQLRTTTGP
jgi:hypothetical protein